MFDYESRYTIIFDSAHQYASDMEKPSIFSKIHPVKSILAETLSFAVLCCTVVPISRGGSLKLCSHGIRGLLPSDSPALLSLTSHPSNSLLSSCAPTLSFHSQQSCNTLTLITPLPKHVQLQCIFGMGGGVCCALFKIAVWECAHVEIVYVWFLKHTFTSMTFPQDDNLDARRPRRKEGGKLTCSKNNCL